jgi:hypothetical protein
LFSFSLSLFRLITAKHALKLAQESGIDFIVQKLKTTDIELLQSILHCLANLANAGSCYIPPSPSSLSGSAPPYGIDRL